MTRCIRALQSPWRWRLRTPPRPIRNSGDRRPRAPVCRSVPVAVRSNTRLSRPSSFAIAASRSASFRLWPPLAAQINNIALAQPPRSPEPGPGHHPSADSPPASSGPQPHRIPPETFVGRSCRSLGRLAHRSVGLHAVHGYKSDGAGVHREHVAASVVVPTIHTLTTGSCATTRWGWPATNDGRTVDPWRPRNHRARRDRLAGSRSLRCCGGVARQRQKSLPDGASRRTSLKPAAPLWVYGANDEGTKSAAKVMMPVLDGVETIDARKHCRVLISNCSPNHALRHASMTGHRARPSHLRTRPLTTRSSRVSSPKAPRPRHGIARLLHPRPRPQQPDSRLRVRRRRDRRLAPPPGPDACPDPPGRGRRFDDRRCNQRARGEHGYCSVAGRPWAGRLLRLHRVESPIHVALPETMASCAT